MPDDNDNLSSIADYYASQGMSNPQLSYDQNGNPIFQSNKLPVDLSNLKDYAATLPVATPNQNQLPIAQSQPWQMYQPQNFIDFLTHIPTEVGDLAHVATTPELRNRVWNGLTGTDGLERSQTFPERIARSALSLPTDVMSGKVQTPVSGGNKVLSSDEDSEDELLQRVQDMAALMGGGGVAMAEKGALGTAGGRLIKPNEIPIRLNDAQVGHEALTNLTKPDHYYRAMTEDEYNATVGAGKGIVSNQSHSISGEGTSFAHDAPMAESYANFGRTDPRKTGKPTYLVEVKGQDGLVSTRDGYLKAANEISPDRITRVVKMAPEGNSIVGNILKSDNEAAAPIAALENHPFTTDAYHGTAGTFLGDALKARPGQAGNVDFYSTSNPDLASRYADPSLGNKPQILPLKLNTSDYHVFDAKGMKWDEVNEKAIAQARANKKNGVTIKNVIDEPEEFNTNSNDKNTVHIAFDPSTVRSRFAKFDPTQFNKSGLLLSDTTKPGTAIAALEKAPIFHSAVENAVNTASLKSAPPQQWLSTIANAKGVKPEELDWTGLKDFLQEQKEPVSKEQIQQYLEQNKVELKEVNKGKTVQNRQEELEAIHPDERTLQQVNELEDIHNGMWDGEPAVNSSETKYSKYQLPGEATNYREKLLTLPEKPVNFGIFKDENQISHNFNDAREARQWAIDNGHLGGATVRQTNEVHDYKSSHWDEPNVLAHIRMNDRSIPGQGFTTREEAQKYFDNLPEGMKKNIDIVDDLQANKKALHIEEIQSDWHQQGREQGYKITDAQKKELESIDNKLTSKLSEGDIGNPDMDTVLKTAVEKKVITSQEAANYKQWSKGENSNIPDAPFKKTWLDLAAKRIIREAAEQGKDVLSWTPGEAQAARYDLSKQVDSIGITPEGKNGEKTHITVNAKSGVHASGFFDKNGKLVQGYDSFKGSEGKNLSDLVGKEVAEKIMNRANNQPPRPTELPEGYHTIIDKNNKGNEWGVIPPDQKHAKSLVGWHPTEEEATRQAINLIHAGKVRENNVLKNIDLKLGGEGMHYFYDKMLPSVLEKLTGQKMKVGNVDQPGGIGQWSYKGPNRSVDDIIKIARNAPSVSIEHQLGDIANAMKDGNDFGTAVEMHGSYHAAKMLGGELTPVKKPVPINYIDLPQSVKDTALHKGFPLFSSGLMLSPVEDNPFAKSKYKLVPVDHNPFKEKK